MNARRSRIGAAAGATLALFLAAIAAPRGGIVVHSHPSGEHAHVHVEGHPGSTAAGDHRHDHPQAFHHDPSEIHQHDHWHQTGRPHTHRPDVDERGRHEQHPHDQLATPSAQPHPHDTQHADTTRHARLTQSQLSAELHWHSNSFFQRAVTPPPPRLTAPTLAVPLPARTAPSALARLVLVVHARAPPPFA